jgi:hypothetical protein
MVALVTSEKLNKAEIEAAIEGMTFEALTRCMDEISISSPMWVWTSLSKRLIEIALYDNHVPTKQRENALARLETINLIVTSGFKDKPDVIALYQEANRYIIEEARQIGFGTLAWMVKELNITSDEELVRFLSLPENASQLENFLSMLGPEGEVLRSTIAKRAQGNIE